MTHPKLLNRTLFRELALTFALCLTVFLVLILVGKMLKLRQILFALDLNGLDLLRLFLYLTPFFLMLLLPVACMISMFLAFQRMSADRELMALRTMGVSLIQILPAPLLFVLLSSGLGVGLSFYGISWGMDHFQQTMLHLAKTKAQLSLRPGIFNQDFPGLTIYTNQVDRRSGVMHDVFVRDSSSTGSEVSIVAPEGRVITDNQRGRILFSLKDGRIYRQNEDRIGLLSFSTYDLILNLGRMFEDLDVDRDKPKYMSWSELQSGSRQAQTASAGGLNAERLSFRVEQHKRLALAGACFVLGLFAIPLGWIFEGLKRHYGGILVLSMFFAYYGLFSLGVSLGETGKMAPELAIWTPNVLFLGLALGLVRMAVKERGGWLLRWASAVTALGRKVFGK